MKSFASIRLGSLGSISLQHSITSGSDRPPGVAADCWIRLEENLGLVVTPPPLGSSATPVATGQLMFKHNGYWLRLQLEGAPPAVRAVPAQAT